MHEISQEIPPQSKGLIKLPEGGKRRDVQTKLKHMQLNMNDNADFNMVNSMRKIRKSSNMENQTFFRFPETFWSARFCFPTLKSTAVTAGVGFRARWVGSNPITHNLHI